MKLNQILQCSALALFATSSSASQCWHAAREFSKSANPSGQWTYGWSGAPVARLKPPSSFKRYTSKGVFMLSSLDWWHAQSAGRTFLPGAFANRTQTRAGPINGTLWIPPLALVLHPGTNNEHSILRWTAATNGTYDVTVNFKRIGTTNANVDVHVVAAGKPIWTKLLPALFSGSFSSRLTLQAGQSMDFSVGIGSDSLIDDSTRIDAHIHLVSSSPGWFCLPRPTSGFLGDPVLDGQGTLKSSASTRVSLDRAAPGQPAFFVIGASQINVAVLGGLLVPNPDLVLGLPVAANGRATLSFALPANTPPRSRIWFQAWILDPAAPGGFSSTNGLLARTQ